MLTYLHRGTVRYREDAYRSYCEYVDLSGLCQPTAEFIYLCMESFADEARRYGIDLICQRMPSSFGKPKWFPGRSERESVNLALSEFDGLVLLATQADDDASVPQFLAARKNIPVLLPNHFANTYAGLWSKPEALRPSIEDFLKWLRAALLARLSSFVCDNALLCYVDWSRRGGHFQAPTASIWSAASDTSGS